MQLLEGERAAFDEALVIIGKDLRRRDIVILEAGPIAARSFADWWMGFHEFAVADAQALPGFAPFFARRPGVEAIGARKGLALDLLTSFRDTNR